MTNTTLRRPNRHDEHVLRQLLEHRHDAVVTDEDTLVRHNMDWNRQYVGNSKLLVRPRDTKEVSIILQYCHHHRIGVVPQAGNTGLVGGSVPTDRGEIILSIERMNRIESFDRTNGVLRCEAGCILQHLQDYVASKNYLVPVDLGSKGTCMIGGNVSTNAGGQYFYRFGSIHSNLLGLEAVLADGTILDLMNDNRKNNTGYHLKNLFVGAEGTLGVITRVSISCPRLPKSRNTAMLVCDSFDHVQELLLLAKEELGEILAAFEFMDSTVFDIVAETKIIPSNLRSNQSFPSHEIYYILVETQGSNQTHDQEKLDYFLSKSLELGLMKDGVLAQDLSQVHQMWSIRESCNPSIKIKGYNYKYDISLPVNEFANLIQEVRSRISHMKNSFVCNWGHIVDGNLHLNVVTPGMFELDPMLKATLEPYIFEAVAKRNGSISAEHGIGQCKKDYLGTYAQTLEAVEYMNKVKDIFDPRAIMNPGKLLPSG